MGISKDTAIFSFISEIFHSFKIQRYFWISTISILSIFGTIKEDTVNELEDLTALLHLGQSVEPM